MRLSNLAQTALQEGYKELTTAQKRAWNLCKRQGLSEGDAASKLNITRASLQNRLECATKKMKKHWELIKEQYGN